jgi:hypothetical protein
MKLKMIVLAGSCALAAMALVSCKKDQQPAKSPTPKYIQEKLTPCLTSKKVEGSEQYCMPEAKPADKKCTAAKWEKTRADTALTKCDQVKKVPTPNYIQEGLTPCLTSKKVEGSEQYCMPKVKPTDKKCTAEKWTKAEADKTITKCK